MLKLAAAVLTLVGIAATARADSGAGGDRSEALATTLSVGGSLVGPALIVGATACCDGPSATTPYAQDFRPMVFGGVAAMVLGPSLGELYAGKPLTRGLGLRVAGGVVLAAGAGLFVHDLFSSDGGAFAGAGLVVAGGGAVIVGTGMDIWDAHTNVRDYNRAHRKLAIVPTANRGLAVLGTF